MKVQVGTFPRIAGFLGGITLISDIAGIGYLVIQALNHDNSSFFAVQIITVGLGFFLGFSLLQISRSGTGKESIKAALNIYIWAYLLLACATYLIVAFYFRSPYTVLNYISFITIIGVLLGAFTILRMAARIEIELPFALALLTVSVFHFLMFLYQFLVVGVPETGKVLSELGFWFGWTLFSIPLITGEMSKGRFRRFGRNKQ